MKLKIILLIGLLITSPLIHSQDMLILADGGTAFFGFKPSDPERYPAYIENLWKDTKLTVKVENAIVGTSVYGEVAHPYGGGEFTENIIANEIIENVSISTFQNKIHFSFRFIAVTSNELTPLLSVKPTPADDAFYRFLKRPGEYTGPSPYPVEWVELKVVDPGDNPVPVIPKVNSILYYTDVSVRFYVQPVGFEDDVVFVGIYSVNDALLYPVVKMYEEDGLFRWPTPTSRITVDSSLIHDPSVYEVRLANGKTFLIPNDGPVDGVRVLNASALINDWQLYH